MGPEIERAVGYNQQSSFALHRADFEREGTVLPDPLKELRLTQKGVLLRSEAEPANTPLVDQAR
jgi:hypothetical protein